MKEIDDADALKAPSAAEIRIAKMSIAVEK